MLNEKFESNEYLFCFTAFILRRRGKVPGAGVSLGFEFIYKRKKLAK